MIVLTNEEFLVRTTIDLEAKINSQNVDKVQAATIMFKRWSKQLYRELAKRSTAPIPADEKLNELQIDTLKDCMADYGVFIYNNGDPKSNGYYDADTNREYHVLITSIVNDLKNVGLIRRSF